MNWRLRAMILLGGIGIVVATYLTLMAHSPESVVCSIGGSCEIVLSSKYASFYGMPTAAFGIIWYVAFLFILWLALIKRMWSVLPLQIWAVGGLVTSLYLLYLEAFVIHAYCTWCLVSLGVIVLLNLLVFAKKKSNVW